MKKYDEPKYVNWKIVDNVISSKKAENKKNLDNKKIRRTIKRRMNKFKQSKVFFHNLRTIKFNKDLKESLMGCYSPDAKYFEIIKTLIVQAKEGTKSKYNSKCPYCTIHTAETIDHILPKSIFPELSFTPGNLIYICDSCNRKKDDKYINGLERIFINPYRDEFLNRVFIKVKLELILYDNIFNLKGMVKYDTSSCNSFDSKIILNHYKYFNLISKMNDELIDMLEEIQINLEENSYDNQMKTFEKMYDKSVVDFGINHFKTALYYELLNSRIVEEFYLKNRLVINT